MNNDIIKENSNKVYDKAFFEFGNDTKAVLWNNQQRQYLRFHELVRFIDFNDSTKEALEVGCGICDLYKYLNFNGYRGKFTGYDINKNFVELAKNKYDDIDVKVVDILESEPEKKFDYVLMSGVFNTNCGQDMDWVKNFVSKMFNLCNNHIAFNAISSFVNHKDDSMYYIDPLEITRFCIENLSKRVTLLHHNLPYNYTVVVFKDEDLNTIIEK